MKSKKDLIEPLKAKGAKIITGDVGNVSTLTEAVKGQDTIVSTLGSFNITDEKNIIQAAKASGTVKRIVPSQYGIDLAKYFNNPGYFAAKISVFEEIKKAGFDYTLIYSSMFYEYAFGAGTGLDAEKGVIFDFGDSAKISTIATADIAKVFPVLIEVLRWSVCS